MERGFLYLVAVMDWFSRYVLAWRLSNTLTGSARSRTGSTNSICVRRQNSRRIVRPFSMARNFVRQDEQANP
jgi:hypothetical protein